MEPTVSECRALARTQNHFAVLDIAWDASDADVKSAYFKKVKRFHPDAASPEVRDSAEAALFRIVTAWEALRTKYDRVSYWERVATLDARPGYWERVARPSVPEPRAGLQDTWSFIARARECIRVGNFWEAIQLLEGVSDQLRGADRRDAMFLLAFAYSKNPQRRHRATELLADLLKVAPSYGKARDLLASIYDDLGLHERANHVRRGGRGDAGESGVVR